MSTSKFYMFDCGIVNALLSRKELPRTSSDFGKSLEQAIFLEIRAYLDYTSSEKKLEYWRSTSKFEIDFLIYNDLNEIVAIEVKANENPGKKDLKGFKAFEEDFKLKRKIIVCSTNIPLKKPDGTEILPINTFLDLLWSGKIV